MYNEIQIISTDEADKYLFIRKNNLIYGGFVIKDVVELLKKMKCNEAIAKELSCRYNIEVKVEIINTIVNDKLNNLLINPQKKKSLKKILKVNLDTAINYPNFIQALFRINFFYFFLFSTFILNTIFYFYRVEECSVSIWNKIEVYFMMFVILILHEFGHIISAKFFNTNVKEIGIGIYRIIPVLYVNLDEIWKLNKRKRIIVNLSGIYFQLIIGIFLMLFFEFSQEKIWNNLFRINYTVLILNLNPFFQFDGYWVFADIINERNLNYNSNQYLRNILKNDVSIIIRLYTFLRVSFFAYILYHFILKIIVYVS